MLDDIKLELISSIIIDVSNNFVLPYYNNEQSYCINTKGSHLDLVTDADIAVEKIIIDQLSKHFPDAKIIGEESSYINFSTNHNICDFDLCFLVDPIDGTSNFSMDVPVIGIMISVVVRGETQAGFIYEPIIRRLTVATIGGGAWTRKIDLRNEQRLKVSQTQELAQMSVGLSWGLFPQELKVQAINNLKYFAAGFHFRSAAIEYRLASQGKVDILCYWRIRPWDHAAGVLIHTEAGGYSRHLDGSKYCPSNNYGGILVAPNEDVWHKCLKVLFPDFDKLKYHARMI